MLLLPYSAALACAPPESPESFLGPSPITMDRDVIEELSGRKNSILPGFMVLKNWTETNGLNINADTCPPKQPVGDGEAPCPPDVQSKGVVATDITANFTQAAHSTPHVQPALSPVTDAYRAWCWSADQR
jgi:hypothetical protein